MDTLLATLDMYRAVFRRAGGLALKNWPVLASVFAYGAIILVALRIASTMGFLGGFLMGLVFAACTGSFLYLVEMIVRTSRVTLEDFKRSFGAYLWDVLGVSFVFYLFWMIVGPALASLPQGPVIVLCINIAIFVLFNAVPELIYLAHHSLASLLSESYRFIAENWIEWFPPNILLFVLLRLMGVIPADGVAFFVAQQALMALFVYFAMVVRGLLFIELSGTTRRGRAFRRKMGL